MPEDFALQPLEMRASFSPGHFMIASRASPAPESLGAGSYLFAIELDDRAAIALKLGSERLLDGELRLTDLLLKHAGRLGRLSDVGLK